ncbi:hypothetical protein H632_c3675p0, partial [Helicosporidium sp. ATCC 50920]
MTRNLVPVALLLELKDRYTSESFLWDASQNRQAMLDFAVTYCRESSMNVVHARTLAGEMARQVGAWSVRKQASQNGAVGAAAPPPAARDLHTISLDCWVDTHQLQDSFLWDLNDDQASPEAFARQMASDLGLDGRAAVTIAIAIHRQLAAVRHSRGRGSRASEHAPPLWKSADQAAESGPRLVELDQATRLEREREVQGKGRAPFREGASS